MTFVSRVGGLSALCLMLGATMAFAFEHQNSGGAPAPATPAPAQAAPAAPATPAPDLGLSEIQGAKPAGGTEIRIPGLGKLGVLPKMDFGLELLYGAADDKAADPGPQVEGDQDLTVRGSVKHRF